VLHNQSLSILPHTCPKDQPSHPTPKASEKPCRIRKQNNYVRGVALIGSWKEVASADVTQLSVNLISRASENWIALWTFSYLEMLGAFHTITRGSSKTFIGNINNIQTNAGEASAQIFIPHTFIQIALTLLTAAPSYSRYCRKHKTFLRNHAGGGAVGLRHCARKVAGSIPIVGIGIFHWHNPHYGHGVDSASNRNYNQKRAKADGLTTLMCILSWNLGAQTSRNLQGLYRNCFTFTFIK
jgi:hypothetical protein